MYKIIHILTNTESDIGLLKSYKKEIKKLIFSVKKNQINFLLL